MNATTNPEIRPGTAFLWLGLVSIAAAGGALAVGYLPTRTLAGPAGVSAMFLGMGIALVAALAGLVPPLLFVQRPPREQLTAVLTGMAIRFILTLGLLIAVMLAGQVHRVSAALWVAIGYVVLLAVDTIGVARLTRRGARSSS